MAGKRSRESIRSETVAEGPAAPQQPAKPKNRKKRAKKVDESRMTEAEILRRQKQRQLRELAVSARASGKDYNPHKAKAVVYKDVNNGVVTPRPSQSKKTQPEPPSRKPFADFQVAIIPIFWNQNPAQKKMVIAKCKTAAEILGTAGITSHVDDGSHCTPGQKMRHWEEKGVKVRLEVGPKDAEQSQCIIARSQRKAGQVAHKIAGEISALLPAAVQALLAMKDADVPPGDTSKYEKKAAAAAAKKDSAGTAAGTSVSEAKEDDHADDMEEDDIDAAQPAQRKVGGGDTLDDDFSVSLELDDVPEALTSADKKRLRKKQKSGLLRRKVLEGSDAVTPKAIAKKAKVVKF